MSPQFHLVKGRQVCSNTWNFLHVTERGAAPFVHVAWRGANHNNAAWPMAAIWLIGAGIIMAALAGLAGLADVFGEQRIRFSMMRGGTLAAS
jgi:uncharacterized membrane protein